MKFEEKKTLKFFYLFFLQNFYNFDFHRNEQSLLNELAQDYYVICICRKESIEATTSFNYPSAINQVLLLSNRPYKSPIKCVCVSGRKNSVAVLRIEY